MTEPVVALSQSVALPSNMMLTQVCFTRSVRKAVVKVNSACI